MFWAVEDNEDILAQSFDLPRWSANLDLDRELPVAKPELFRSELADYDLFADFLEAQCTNFRQVFLVLGNHEFYGISRANGLKLAAQLENEPRFNKRLRILNRTRIELAENITLLGCYSCRFLAHSAASEEAVCNVLYVQMESLSEEVWDVVIAGTSLPQSLLALALSRSCKKVLHVDRNAYYGGQDTGLSLQDARQWTRSVNAGGSAVFSDAAITVLGGGTAGPVSLLEPSRAYTLSLNPQIVYAQSRFLPALVSSHIHSQLEFQAVGSWWICRDGKLQKIPSTREDVFDDDSLSVRDKRSLMKFLRYVLQDDDAQNEASAEAPPSTSLADALETRFRVPAALQAPIVALALSPQLAATTDFNYATTRIRRHMRSAGYFGPGLGAVLAKYGGNAEISQVACRAQAVGGGVYLLGTGLKAVHAPSTMPQDSVEAAASLTRVELSDGTEIKARWVVGGVDDLPPEVDRPLQDHQASPTVTTYHTIDIVSSPLQHLFPPTAENGHVPVVAIVLVLEDAAVDTAPIYLQVHSEDSGECPSGQTVIYASVQSDQPNGVERLKLAVSKLLHLEHDPAAEKPQSIWNMSYTSHQPAIFHDTHLAASNSPPSNIVSLQTRPHDQAVQDETLDEIKGVWTAILGDEAASQPFLRFEQREQDPDPDE
ncbi:hypothetical protein DV737_g332, partial [Chaetothyriales sp. CBS 132003]